MTSSPTRSPASSRSSKPATRLELLRRARDLRAERARAEALRWARWRDDPVGFVRHVLHEDPWSVQCQILEALWRDRRVVVPSCFDSGKSWVAARAVLAWVSTDPEAIAITSSTTGQQMRSALWGEVRKGYRPFLPGVVAPRAANWYVSPSNWAEGISPRKTEAFQGRHEGRVLVVIDEATGVEPFVYNAMEGLLASADTAVLLIANPTEPAGPFYDAATSPDWTCLSISAFDTPNFTRTTAERFSVDPDGQAELCEVVNPKLVTPAWVAQRLREWGPGDPRWIGGVLGQFPDLGEANVVPLAWFNAGVERGRSERALSPERPVMGLDIARFGGDDSAIVIRQGDEVVWLERRSGIDAVAVAGWARELFGRYRCASLHGDAAGLGGPVLDILRAQGVPATDVQAGGKPRDPEHYARVRDEMWFAYREVFREQRVRIGTGCRPTEVALLRRQSTALRYRYDLSGRIVVESKDDALKRGIASPDLADAACLAFYHPVGGGAYLVALAPPCPTCGRPNRRGTPACEGCGAELDVAA